MNFISFDFNLYTFTIYKHSSNQIKNISSYSNYLNYNYILIKK
jgi:hypothetical protein